MSEGKGVELKKYTARQNKDGWIVSFVVHPDDYESNIVRSPVGTVFMCGFVEMTGDSEDAPEPEKPKRKFEDMSQAGQAALLCKDDTFQYFLSLKVVPGVGSETAAIYALYDYLAVNSRADIDDKPQASKRWDQLVKDFRAYQAEQQYPDELSKPQSSNERAAR